MQWMGVCSVASSGISIRIVPHACCRRSRRSGRCAERHVAEVDRIIRGYFDARDDMEPVTRGELSARMAAGLVVVIDVRPPDEFALGHVPGAINVPLRDLESRLWEIDPTREVMAYCRGPWCVMSFEAVAALRGRGIAARRLEDGMPEWKAAGLPVETLAFDAGFDAR
jgi:ArsR family transcriptional regulator